MKLCIKPNAPGKYFSHGAFSIGSLASLIRQIEVLIRKVAANAMIA